MTGLGAAIFSFAGGDIFWKILGNCLLASLLAHCAEEVG
jgi:hypothetical protein